jgi:outer membrane lipoprotein-sorting protein
MLHKLLLTAASLVLVSIALAQAPVDNISSQMHPNLAAAQRLSTQAYQKIVAAQQANDWDMAGHAQKAKDLLEQVNRELKAAALAASDHR